MRLVGAIAGLVLIATSAWAQPAPTFLPALAPGEALLSVASQGRHLVTPDLVRMAIGVTTANASSREAVRSNADLTARLVSIAREAGIAARDVQTSRLRLEPTFAERRGDQPPQIVGFVASNEFVVRIRDVERVPALIDALYAAGATNVRGPQFSLNDPIPSRRLAERAAVVEARAKAENLATAMGKRVGRLLTIRSQDYYSEIIVTGSRVRASSETPIEPGEVAVTASIQADFALIDRE